MCTADIAVTYGGRTQTLTCSGDHDEHGRHTAVWFNGTTVLWPGEHDTVDAEHDKVWEYR